MKTVRLKNGVVVEVIPEYALPVERWYGAAFAAQCVEAPDEVEQRWSYAKKCGIFTPPSDVGEETGMPTTEERLAALEQAITKGLSL